MKRFARSFAHAIRGIGVVMRSERNFRIELMLGILACAIAIFVNVPVWPVVLVSVIVLALEMINSSIERLVDIVKPELHPIAKDMKDISAGAVLVAAVGSVIFALMYLLVPLLTSLGIN